MWCSVFLKRQTLHLEVSMVSPPSVLSADCKIQDVAADRCLLVTMVTIIIYFNYFCSSYHRECVIPFRTTYFLAGKYAAVNGICESFLFCVSVLLLRARLPPAAQHHRQVLTAVTAFPVSADKWPVSLPSVSRLIQT